MRKLLFFPIKENYFISQQLVTCYKQHFNIIMFIIVINIIRNILICNTIDENKKNMLFNKIIAIEKIFNNNRKIYNDFYFGYILNKENIEHINVYKDYPFILLPTKEIMIGIQDKYLIWYGAPNIINEIKINNAINEIENICMNDKLNTFTKSFSQIYINETQFKNIYGITNTNDVTNIKEKYLYNISCLIDNNGNEKKEKKQLDIFLAFCLDIKKIFYYNYSFYHYITDYDTSTLHIHIYSKKTKYLYHTSLYSLGNNTNFSHEHFRIPSFEYKKFNTKEWFDEHDFLIKILYYEKIKKLIKTLNINMIYSLINSNMSIQFYDIIYNFMIMCYTKGVFTSNYFSTGLPKCNDCIKIYFKSLLSYKNNLNIIVTELYNIHNN
jgi:hypothetical protein